MKFKFIAILLLLSCSFVSMAETCTASWYGDSFQGRKTASGKRFNTHSFMAAHKRLPFGTKVLVTNLSNNRRTEVIILDRGPFVRGRCIDLSQAAKNAIGMRGTSKVSLEVIR
jgi:rare lipoprotein A